MLIKITVNIVFRTPIYLLFWLQGQSQTDKKTAKVTPKTLKIHKIFHKGLGIFDVVQFYLFSGVKIWTLKLVSFSTSADPFCKKTGP